MTFLQITEATELVQQGIEASKNISDQLAVIYSLFGLVTLGLGFACWWFIKKADKAENRAWEMVQTLRDDNEAHKSMLTDMTHVIQRVHEGMPMIPESVREKLRDDVQRIIDNIQQIKDRACKFD